MAERIINILECYPTYEATIGIEVHVQLNTQSKLFCSCPNVFGKEPNTNICPICAGHPGTLPVLNKKAVEYALMLGLATNCKISPQSDFARKHYFYPDLPKNYQITQGDIAICMHGAVPTQTLDGLEKLVRLERIHIEEDAGKVLHMPHNESYVDLNRAGTPLLEIVSAPDMANAHEAKQYLMNLHAIVQYLGISDANMEQGSFRADINISVKKKTDKQLGVRSEVKNVNSFKFIAQAINYEIERHIGVLEEGGSLHQDTRLWNEKEQKTSFMRAKGNADDYRYFPEPDLGIVQVDEQWLAKLKAAVPELPLAKKERFITDYHLSSDDATILVADKALATYYEETVKHTGKPRMVANWILRDVLSYLKEHKLAIGHFPLTPLMLSELLQLVDEGVISANVGQEVLGHMAATKKSAAVIVEEKGLKQISNSEELRVICQTLVDEHADIVEKYKAGNTRLFGFFVGQAMKATKGKANPHMLTELFNELLA